MPEWLTTILTTLIPSLAVGFFTAIITVRLSLRQFHAERWWERKADAYSQIVEALHNAVEYCHAMAHESMTGNEMSVEYKKRLTEKYGQAHREIRRATGIGAYIISDEVAEVLTKLEARPSLDWSKSATFEYFDHEHEGYKAALQDIRRLAKKDLKIR
jgi:hypothetical protein